MDRVDHTDEDPVIGLGVLLDDPEDPGPVALAGQLDVEASDREPEQCREELPVVHVSAVSRILVAPRARVNPDPRPLLWRKTLEDAVVEGHEVVQETLGRIELDRQPPLREIDLHAVGASLQAPPDVLLGLAHQVVGRPDAGAATGVLRRAGGDLQAAELLAGQ